MGTRLRSLRQAFLGGSPLAFPMGYLLASPQAFREPRRTVLRADSGFHLHKHSWALAELVPRASGHANQVVI